MFIGWLKFADVNAITKIGEEVGWLVDGYHIKLMMMHSPHLCYGAYEEGELIGAIMAIEYQKSVQIKYFMVKPTYQKQGYGERLFQTILNALSEYKTIYLHATTEMVPYFEKNDFEENCQVGRFLNVGKVPPFSFTNANAKELDGENFEHQISKIDFETFQEDRMSFLLDEMERNSSLKFSLPNGFQHSSIVNARSLYLGPWQVRSGNDEEAEKFMRGVLYFRGLKKIFSDVPLSNKSATDLFKKYHFEKKKTFHHMTRGEKRSVKFENIYAFSL